MTPGDTAYLALTALHVLTATWAGLHALMNKRDPRSVWAWVTTCVLIPIGGALLYWWFGINRVQRRAEAEFGPAPQVLCCPMPDALPRFEGSSAAEIAELVRTGAAMTGRPLLPGNELLPLHHGEQAYPAMFEAIAQAQRSIWISSYILAGDEVGQQLAELLRAAQQRGVQVCVLVDGVGELLWRPRGAPVLRAQGLRVERFFPPRWFPPMLHVNLRNHRKLMVVDGHTAFTGGMNIGSHHLIGRSHAQRTADLHFRLRGPVVTQLAQVFAEDWQLTTDESLPLPATTVPSAGESWCRAITDGPNDRLDRLQMVLLAALSNAHHRVQIMTPYFSPTYDIVGALQSAALRGIDICLILPQRSDQPWTDAAARRWLLQLLEYPIRVFLQPPPFAHTKLLLVDDYYAQIGSANLDARSLRLNFELMVEVYDAAAASPLRAHFESVQAQSQPLTRELLTRRSLPARLTDAFCWMFSPYL